MSVLEKLQTVLNESGRQSLIIERQIGLQTRKDIVKRFNESQNINVRDRDWDNVNELKFLKNFFVDFAVIIDCRKCWYLKTN